jgi:pyridoxal phosphate enzyme (YggS family)
MAGVAESLAAVRSRIAQAARRIGREPGEVRLVAVSKGQPAELIAEAVAAGCEDLGENYVQELVAKQEAVPAPVRWHFIGPLQRNKARQVVGRIALLHSLDSADLAVELEKRAAARGALLEVLCQVNVAKEPQKHGVLPEAVEDLLEVAQRQPHLVVRGLMTIPPAAPEAEASRMHFRALRFLRDVLRARYPALDLLELSMGMTGDFEVAVEEGATLVRIGTAIFGERPKREKAG